MDKTRKHTGNQFSNHFLEESPQTSSKPVASSTFMVSKTEFDFNDFDNTFQSPKPSSVSGLSTTSSLGVLDLEKHSLLCDEADISEGHRLSRQFVLEQRALSLSRINERLRNMSLTNTSSDANKNDAADNKRSSTSNRFTTIYEPSVVNANAAKTFDPSLSPKLSQQSGFSNMSHMTSGTDPSFECVNSNQAIMKLEADQKENRQHYGSLPVSPINISVNSENIEEREKKFSECVENRCYSADDIGKVLRNRTIVNQNENDTSTNRSAISNLLDLSNTYTIQETEPKMSTTFSSKIPDFMIDTIKDNDAVNDSSRGKDLLHGFPRTEFQFNNTTSGDVKVAAADSTFFQNTFEESCASSIASIHQIAEALRRKSLMSEPKRAIEHLLSMGKTKSKYAPCMSPVADVRNEDVNVENGVCLQPISTPIASQYTSANTPSTITCPARDYRVDSITGKVYAGNSASSASLATARHLLQAANRKLSNLDFSVPKTMPASPTKYFNLVKTSSPLDIIEEADQKNYTAEFWKLTPEGCEPSDGVLNTSHRLSKFELARDPMKTHQANDSCSKINGCRKPVRRISLNHNPSNTQDSIYVDSLDADSMYSEVILAGVLCVGTQVEVIIAIENPVDRTLRYKMTLKSIVADQKDCLSAASVMLVSENPDINLLPNVENEIKIMLSPLIEGKIEVVLEFVGEEKSFSNIIRRIKVTGERPKMRLLKPEQTDINLGILPEGESKMTSLKLKNEGSARLPLKLVIHEDNRKRMFSARTVVEPYDIFDCDIRFTSSEIFNVSSDITRLDGELDVLLDTSEEVALGSTIRLQTIQLSAQVARIHLLLNDDVPLVLLKSGTSKLKVKNISPIPVNISIKLMGDDKSEFSVEQKIFHLLPNNEQLVKISFKPNAKDKKREIYVQFAVNGSNKTFSCQVIGTLEGDLVVFPAPVSTPVRRSNDMSFTPQSNSSSSSSTGADGPMELDCTHNSISWGSVALHSKSVQTITLRNRNSQREKLLLSISDSSGTFKFVENEVPFRDLKLTLEPKESRKISVLFMPFVADQAVNGRIVIMRRHSLDTSVSQLRKRLIPLYGIGGKVKIAYSGVFQDEESRLWITPDTDTFETKFTVENTGDSVGFVKFVSEDSDDSVVPEELILLPKESSEVIYNLNLNRDRLDLLYKQNPQKEVLSVNKLMVFSGCEATRLRLKKLWLKYKEFENIQRIRDKIEILMDMGSHGKVQVDALADSKSTLNKLWYEEVTEQSIGVLISQQHLESACLDSTVVFKDLADLTTIP